MQAANVILNFPEVIITKVKDNGGVYFNPLTK